MDDLECWFWKLIFTLVFGIELMIVAALIRNPIIGTILFCIGVCYLSNVIYVAPSRSPI
jgi:hypothetical protein